MVALRNFDGTQVRAGLAVAVGALGVHGGAGYQGALFVVQEALLVLALENLVEDFGDLPIAATGHASPGEKYRFSIVKQLVVEGAVRRGMVPPGQLPPDVVLGILEVGS